MQNVPHVLHLQTKYRAQNVASAEMPPPSSSESVYPEITSSATEPASVVFSSSGAQRFVFLSLSAPDSQRPLSACEIKQQQKLSL